MKLSFIISLLFFISCGQKNIDLFMKPYQNSQNILFTQISLDTITLDHVESSYLGQSGITLNDEIYFMDTYYCWFFTFDTNGIFQNRYLGQGRAPHETTAGKIAGHTILHDKNLFLLGFQLDHYVYDSTFNIEKMFFLKRNESADVTSTSAIYTHQYDRLVCRNYKDHIYINMYSEHPNLDYIEQTGRYMEKCRHISEVNIKTGKDERMLGGGYPEIYKNNPYKFLIFSGINFDLDTQGNFYVSFDADSLIYKYDFNYNPILSFGFSGKNMDMDYKIINSYKECRKYYYDERENKGFYSWMHYESKTNLLFRSYQKGNNAIKDGLQIYKNTTLIADIDVPQKFRIAGYIAPYYYSQIIVDEEKEKMTIYRFKLKIE